MLNSTKIKHQTMSKTSDRCQNCKRFRDFGLWQVENLVNVFVLYLLSYYKTRQRPMAPSAIRPRLTTRCNPPICSCFLLCFSSPTRPMRVRHRKKNAKRVNGEPCIVLSDSYHQIRITQYLYLTLKTSTTSFQRKLSNGFDSCLCATSKAQVCPYKSAKQNIRGVYLLTNWPTKKQSKKKKLSVRICKQTK